MAVETAVTAVEAVEAGPVVVEAVVVKLAEAGQPAVAGDEAVAKVAAEVACAWEAYDEEPELHDKYGAW